MQVLRNSIALLLLLAACPLAGAEGLRVVCTIPDLADVTREIGGERVDVTSIAKGRENVHDVRIKPSHIVAVSRADLFMQVGLSLEHAWVPGLIEVARNKKLRPGQAGFVNISEGWEAIQIPQSFSRQNAVDIHPQGNPHLNLSPEGGRHMATAIHAALVKADEAGKDHYDQRLEAYRKKLEQAEARWAELRKKLSGGKVVLYHRDLDYFLAANDMTLVGTLEPKPGLPPSPGHTVELVKRMKEQGCTTLIVAPWCNNGQARRLAEKAGAELVEIPQMVDGVKGSGSWIQLMDLMHQRLAEALPEREQDG